MRTAFLTLALSLVSLPAIAGGAEYIQLVRGQNNATIGAMTDYDLLSLGLMHCEQMQGFTQTADYVLWLQDDASQQGMSEGAIRVLTTTAIAADWQLCDDPRVQDYLR
jgi:hypothetical protein